MIKRLTTLAAFVLLLAPAFGTDAAAQALKIGYTDHELLIANMDAFRQAQQTLQAAAQQNEAGLQAMFMDYQEKLDRYQKQQALLSEESRKTRENELITLQQEIQQAEQTSNEQLAKRQEELLGPIFQRVEGAINEVAKAKNLDIVLRSHAGPAQPIILYVNEDRIEDITLDVARKLGIQVEDEPSASN
ncbi:MAG: OmpH family outer membrane protein [Rhodothermales bacterium]|nr:OmpH family outer membrane protein [Rhodothermales bacterium]